MSTIKFNGNHSDFYNDLKGRVNAYFQEHQISTHGDSRNVVKTLVLFGIFLPSYFVLAFHLIPGAWALAVCILLGLVIAGIGFNVMHDGAHGSLSGNHTINRFGALTLNMLGASSFLWNIKHNVIHHTYTNVEGQDDDIMNEPLFRMSQFQKKRGIHRWQYLYWPFGYGLMYLAWIFFLDFKKYFSRRIAGRSDIKWKLSNHIGFWMTKVLYVFFFVIIPLQYYSFTEFLIGYLVASFTTGITISVVFQLAHTVQETEFEQVLDESQPLRHDWATHQIYTTANFATGNKVVTWLVGGLNHQVEHHLFPKIAHVHYPAISVFVKESCRKFNLPYHEAGTFGKAVSSHIRFLYNMGR